MKKNFKNDAEKQNESENVANNATSLQPIYEGQQEPSSNSQFLIEKFNEIQSELLDTIFNHLEAAEDWHRMDFKEVKEATKKFNIFNPSRLKSNMVKNILGDALNYITALESIFKSKSILKNINL